MQSYIDGTKRRRDDTYNIWSKFITTAEKIKNYKLNSY